MLQVDAANNQSSVTFWQRPSARSEVESDPQLAQAASRRNRLEAAIRRLTDQIGHVTRHNRLYVAGAMACIGGGLVSLMFFATPLFLLGGNLMAMTLDVRRRKADASARRLGQQRRALEGCVNDPARWLGQPRCMVEGCAAARTCELRQPID